MYLCCLFRRGTESGSNRGQPILRSFDIHQAGGALPSTKELNSGIWNVVLGSCCSTTSSETVAGVRTLANTTVMQGVPKFVHEAISLGVFRPWSGIEGLQYRLKPIIAVIGHELLWVQPKYMSTPFLKVSVLEDFIQTWMMVGFVALSTAMYEKLRCAPESYSLLEGMQTSPACRKPKKRVPSPCRDVLRLFAKRFDLN